MKDKLFLTLVFFFSLATAIPVNGDYQYGDCMNACDDTYQGCLDDCETWCGGNCTGCYNCCSANKNACILSCNSTDQDNDGVNDNEDVLIGDEGDVLSEGISDLDVFIGNTQSNFSNTSTMSGQHTVRFMADSKTILEFENDFDSQKLLLVDVAVKKQKVKNLNGVVISNLALESGRTKTIYVEKSLEHGSICIADKEVDDVTDITADCVGDDEYFFGRCDQGEQIGGISCSVVGNMYRISGLSNSGAVELNISGIYMGYFTVDYPNEGKSHRDGMLMPGESAKICFESARSVREDEFMKLIFLPQYGSITVNEVWMPHIINTYVVNIYPIGMS
ncbi:hypothetical protein JXB31_00560 [Candidatus Woesearchaeota archaeon]|nr:hypothetical protein [Candidatus Woesearchaeota archaeon]